jgi:DNA-binding transcriptional LysR family regulator
VDAQVRGLGGGFLPEPLARPYLDSGRLVARDIQRHPRRSLRLSYAWHAAGNLGAGRALQWWLEQLESPTTRAALLGRHRPA